MYEPKYKLNKRDAKRWHILLTRHCLECPAKPGEKRQRAKMQKKYPPLTPAENAEFEALCEKRSRKVESHPKVRASIRRGQCYMRKLQKLAAELEAFTAKLKIKVDRKS